MNLRQTHFYNFFGCLLRIAKPPHAIKATWKPPSNTHSSWKCTVICKFIYIKRISTFFIAVVTKHRVIMHLFASLLRNQYIHITCILSALFPISSSGREVRKYFTAFSQNCDILFFLLQKVFSGISKFKSKLTWWAQGDLPQSKLTLGTRGDVQLATQTSFS